MEQLTKNKQEVVEECPVCLKPGTSGLLLLECLHCICAECTQKNHYITCQRCREVSRTKPTLPPDFVRSKQNKNEEKTASEQNPKRIQELKLLTKQTQDIMEKLPDYSTEISSRLGELQEEGDNVRSLIEETYQSYKSILETAKNDALEELDRLHNQRELSIMERLDKLDLLEVSMDNGCSYSEKLVDECTSEQVVQLQPFVQIRLNKLIKTVNESMDNSQSAPSLKWSSDSDKFQAAINKSFGSFSTPIIKTNATTATTTSQSCEKMSPIPLPKNDDSPAQVQSYSNQGLLGIVDQSLTGPFPPRMEYFLSKDQPGNETLTLASLISNVAKDRDPNWDEPGGIHALSNLTALAMLDEPQHYWKKKNLLLAEMDGGSNPVSPGAHSLSPVMGSLTVPEFAVRGASPVSPQDTIMPQVGMSISPILQSHPISPISPIPPSMCCSTIPGSPIFPQPRSVSPIFPQPRSVITKLNTMQIRCKFGQLGPAKSQFNSPHGFCLGLDEEIIVADTNNHRIQIFSKDGTYRYQFGIPGKEEGQLWYPRKVAVMKNTGKFVVCDRGNERSRMQIYTKHGHFVRKIAIRYIDIVAGLAITRDGHIVAVDSVTPTMFVISEQGDLLRWFDCADYMREPSDIAVGGSDFYVCDFKGHNVVVFTEDGMFVRRIGCENITNFPNGIDISDAGDVLIGDSHGNRFHVAVFSSDGSLLSDFECPHVKVSRCCGLKITSEGFVVTLAKNNHHVLVLNTLYIA